MDLLIKMCSGRNIQGFQHDFHRISSPWLNKIFDINGLKDPESRFSIRIMNNIFIIVVEENIGYKRSELVQNQVLILASNINFKEYLQYT